MVSLFIVKLRKNSSQKNNSRISPKFIRVYWINRQKEHWVKIIINILISYMHLFQVLKPYLPAF